jgi:HAD superfamily hydrolase (TIGR01509 family)
MNPNPLKTKGIFIDFDGTIVDSTDAYIEAAKIACQTVGLNPPEKQTALEIPRRLEQHMPLTAFTNGKTEKFLQTYYQTYYDVAKEKCKLMPNVSATLQVLSEKSKLALITMRHTPKQAVLDELEYLGVRQYFTHVVTALDTAKPKPSPEALLNCVQAFEVDIAECIIVGDSVSDVRAGKAAGAGTVALLSGLFACEELVKEAPDLILNDVNSLPKYIR